MYSFSYLFQKFVLLITIKSPVNIHDVSPALNYNVTLTDHIQCLNRGQHNRDVVNNLENI